MYASKTTLLGKKVGHIVFKGGGDDLINILLNSSLVVCPMISWNLEHISYFPMRQKLLKDLLSVNIMVKS